MIRSLFEFPLIKTVKDINIDNNSESIINLNENYKNKKFTEIKNITLNEDDHKKHKKFIETIPNNIWSKIIV